MTEKMTTTSDDYFERRWGRRRFEMTTKSVLWQEKFQWRLDQLQPNRLFGSVSGRRFFLCVQRSGNSRRHRGVLVGAKATITQQSSQQRTTANLDVESILPHFNSMKPSLTPFSSSLTSPLPSLRPVSSTFAPQTHTKTTIESPPHVGHDQYKDRSDIPAVSSSQSRFLSKSTSQPGSFLEINCESGVEAHLQATYVTPIYPNQTSYYIMLLSDVVLEKDGAVSDSAIRWLLSSTSS